MKSKKRLMSLIAAVLGPFFTSTGFQTVSANPGMVIEEVPSKNSVYNGNKMFLVNPDDKTAYKGSATSFSEVLPGQMAIELGKMCDNLKGIHDDKKRLQDLKDGGFIRLANGLYVHSNNGHVTSVSNIAAEALYTPNKGLFELDNCKPVVVWAPPKADIHRKPKGFKWNEANKKYIPVDLPVYNETSWQTNPIYLVGDETPGYPDKSRTIVNAHGQLVYWDPNNGSFQLKKDKGVSPAGVKTAEADGFKFANSLGLNLNVGEQPKQVNPPPAPGKQSPPVKTKNPPVKTKKPLPVPDDKKEPKKKGKDKIPPPPPAPKSESFYSRHKGKIWAGGGLTVLGVGAAVVASDRFSRRPMDSKGRSGKHGRSYSQTLVSKSGPTLDHAW